MLQTNLDPTATRKTVFFGGISRSTPPSYIRKFFVDEFGPVERLFLFQNRTRAMRQFNPEIHRGSGFVTFSNENSAKVASHKEFIMFEGQDIQVRRALSETETQQKFKDIKEKRRKIHVGNVPLGTPLSSLSKLIS